MNPSVLVLVFSMVQVHSSSVVCSVPVQVLVFEDTRLHVQPSPVPPSFPQPQHRLPWLHPWLQRGDPTRPRSTMDLRVELVLQAVGISLMSDTEVGGSHGNSARSLLRWGLAHGPPRGQKRATTGTYSLRHPLDTPQEYGVLPLSVSTAAVSLPWGGHH